MDSEASREQALAFLDEIEVRHNQVLDGLDELNQRIEEVLDSQLQSRKAEPGPVCE